MTEEKFNELQESVANKFTSLLAEVANKDLRKILLVLQEDNSREVFFKEFYSRLTEEERFFVICKSFMESVIKILKEINKL